jgi:dolichyl-phosphate-mannose--protein O-mannosyl transferase
MVIRWGVFHTKSRTALKTGWLITAGVVALYLGLIQPRDQARGIASEKVLSEAFP